MSAHTPGPWAVEVEPENESWLKGRTVYSVNEHSRIADVTLFRTDEQAFSDAHLIAAAPDLLAELVSTLAWLKELSRLPSDHAIDIPLEASAYVHTIQKVIAKATGAKA